MINLFYSKSMLEQLDRGISTLITIRIIVALVVVVGGGLLAYQYYHIPKQEIKNLVTETPETETLKSEFTDWNSYTYLSSLSGILPGINFKYPPLFGNNPSLISSPNINPSNN